MHNNVLLWRHRLFQEYLCVVCANNINTFWREKNRRICGDVATANNPDDIRFEGIFIQPPSFIGSRKYLHKHFRNAIAIAREYHKHYPFTTFTCNLQWPEITHSLLPNQQPQYMPDIAAWEFKLHTHSFQTNSHNTCLILRHESSNYTLTPSKPTATIYAWYCGMRVQITYSLLPNQQPQYMPDIAAWEFKLHTHSFQANSHNICLILRHESSNYILTPSKPTATIHAWYCGMRVQITHSLLPNQQPQYILTPSKPTATIHAWYCGMRVQITHSLLPNQQPQYMPGIAAWEFKLHTHSFQTNSHNTCLILRHESSNYTLTPSKPTATIHAWYCGMRVQITHSLLPNQQPQYMPDIAAWEFKLHTHSFQTNSHNTCLILRHESSNYTLTPSKPTATIHAWYCGMRVQIQAKEAEEWPHKGQCHVDVVES